MGVGKSWVGDVDGWLGLGIRQMRCISCVSSVVIQMPFCTLLFVRIVEDGVYAFTSELCFREFGLIPINSQISSSDTLLPFVFLTFSPSSFHPKLSTALGQATHLSFPKDSANLVIVLAAFAMRLTFGVVSPLTRRSPTLSVS